MAYVLNTPRAEKLLTLATPQERGVLAFLCLAMFHIDNCGEYIHQADIDMAKNLFEDSLVDQVIERWFLQEEGSDFWQCLIPIAIECE